MKRNLRRTLALLSAFMMVTIAWGDLPVAQVIRPTVTVASGDTGGMFFGRVPDPRKTRHYYIAAEPELWDFAPSGREELCGSALRPDFNRDRKSGKVRYVQYTDATFANRVIPNPSLGILGPVLRGVVGEYLVVTFLNRSDDVLSMHPHGVKYDKDSEGAYHLNPGRGSAVGPGARYTYVWQLDEQSGPMPDEPSSKGWLYHSHVTGDGETNLGLVGTLIVTDPKRARPDGTPADVDREFATLFLIFDESGLEEAALEAAEYGSKSGVANQAPMDWGELQQKLEEGSRFAINGLAFGNLRGIEMNEGERTRWYLFALGSEQDFHTAHWHGLRVVEEGRRRTDVVDLLPATMKVVDMVADNPGTWLYHCHVAEHMQEGMFTSFTVHARDREGVSREPAAAFLGYYSAGTHSLRIDRAEAQLNLAARPSRADLIIEGAVTVFDGFAAFNEAVRVQVGGRAVTLHPLANGVANDPGARLRVKNADEYGVVRGGVMEFELVLKGAEWMREVEAATAGPKRRASDSAALNADVPGSAPTLTLSLDIARAHHTATHALLRHVQRP